MKSLLAVLVLALALEGARGEWVQVAVIDGRKQGQGPLSPPELQGPKGSERPSQRPSALVPHLAVPDPIGPIGAPGPNVDDVITIRRTVGDSFSNKQGVVPGHQSPDVAQEAPELVEEHDEALDHGVEAGGLSLRVLREAHQTLLRQSTAPVSGKLEFLRRLKNRMLRHIAFLMPLSALSLVGAAVTGRSLGVDVADEGRGHHKGVGFPSNEGTLMSLAFLVFAVFLVKVVMQLIYAVQNSQANANVGVRVAQMQIPGGAMSNMMGTMMSMVPMPPMMAAMNPAMGMGGMRRVRREAAPQPAMDTIDGLDEDVDRMTSRVLDAIRKARARVEQMGSLAVD